MTTTHEPARARGARLTPLLLLAAAACLLTHAPGRSARADEGTLLHELSPSDERAIDKGLKALLELQDKDRTGAIGDKFKVASTSLAGLAFLASGDQIGRGMCGQGLRKAVEYLTSSEVCNRSPDGNIKFDDGGAQQQGKTHAHGFAILFLCEVVDQTDDPERVLEIIRGAVRTSLDAQTELGGWGYGFRGEPESDKDEASVTVTQVQALRAARNVGIAIPAGDIDRAINYIRRSQLKDGSIRYSLTMGVDRSSYELTAAGVSTLNASGVYQSRELQLGLEYMRQKMLDWKAKSTVDKAATEFYFYGNLYAAQAMFQAGGSDWEAWFPGARKAILEKQQDTGLWKSERDFGEAYATSSALLILQVPKRYLPIFQR